MKGLLLRSVSGIVYVAFVVCGILLGETLFGWFLTLLIILALGEFYRLVNGRRSNRFACGVDIVAGLAMMVSIHDAVSGDCQSALLMAVIWLLCIMLRLIMQLYTREPDPLANLARSLMGQIYIALPISLMSVVWCSPQWGPQLLLAMFIMIWLNDTGAFCVGCTIGRHKMFPRVSPKKSWEGLFGGILFAVASAFLFKYCFGQWFEELSLAQMLGMGAVVGVFATWGDLVESLIKRTLGVKDAGNLIPGHGGILDRIDSLLLVSPALVVYLFFISL